MTARSDLFESVEASERDIDVLFQTLAPRIRRSVERHAKDGKITPVTRLAVLQDLDRMLATVYGRRRGEKSPLATMINERANEAVFKPLTTEVERIEHLLAADPELLGAMRRGQDRAK